MRDAPAEHVVGQAGEPARSIAHAGNRHGDVALCARGVHVEVGRFGQKRIARDRQAQHGFADGDEIESGHGRHISREVVGSL